MIARYRNLPPHGKARVWICLGLLALAFIIVFAGKPWTVDIPEGGRPSIRDYVHLWFWPAAVVNFLLLSVVAWLTPLWMRKAETIPGPVVSRKPAVRWFWPGVIAASAFLLISAWPRMSQSVWHDEANRVKNETVGSYKIQPDGTAKFRAVPWLNTFFYCTMPNHVFQTVASRACHETCKFFAGPAGYPVNEAALRLPSLAAGLAGVVMIALLLRAMGMPGAAVVAAWLLALHPWYLRYASEARSYAIAMALVPALLYFLLKALETDRTRWWVAFGLSQWALVYAYVTAVHVLIVLNLLAIPLFLSLRSRGLDLRTVLGKWLAANILSGILFLQLYSPCIPQMVEYLHTAKASGAGWTLDYFWMTNFLAHMLAGVPWTYSKQYPSDHLELMCWAILHPGFFVAICFAAIAFLSIGLLGMARRGPFQAFAAAVLLIPAILGFVQAKLGGTYLFEWYLIFLLPGACALVAAGMADLFPARGKRWFRWLAGGFAATAVLAYAAWTHAPRTLLMQQSVQPYREAVLLTRPSLDPNYPGQTEILTAAFGSRPLVYDPRLRMIHRLEEIYQLMDEADAGGKKLFFNIAYPETSRLARPDLYKYVEKSGRFRRVLEVQGMYPELDLDVHVYLGKDLNSSSPAANSP